MITIISYPDENINESIDEGTSLDSAELMQNIFINVADALTDQYIEVVYNDVTTTLIIEDECRYKPFEIAFLNKDGAINYFTFFKARKESMNITSENYQANFEQNKHEFIDYNVNGRSDFKANTGFINEQNNDAIKQLLLSSKVWEVKEDFLRPLNINSKSIEYKTRANDRLINYELGFTYSYNEIQ